MDIHDAKFGHFKTTPMWQRVIHADFSGSFPGL